MDDHTPGAGGKAGHKEGEVQCHNPSRGRGTGDHTAAGHHTACHTSLLMLVTLQRLTCDMGQWRSDHSLVTLTQGQAPHTVEAVHIGL